jgi:hypothetical protein
VRNVKFQIYEWQWRVSSKPRASEMEDAVYKKQTRHCQ